jgi:hypothetical protein
LGAFTLFVLAKLTRDALRVGVGAPLAAYGLGLLFVGVGLVGAWFHPGGRDPGDRMLRRRLLHPRWTKRRHKAFEFLPRPRPPGWTQGFSLFRLPYWFHYTPDEAVLSWVKPYDVGYCLHVGLGPDNRTGGPLSEERAAEMLGAFRSPTPFIELSPGGEPWLPDRWPGGRMWMAPAGEPWSSPPPRSVAKPALLDHPVDEHHAATRKHLPEKLPPCWWPPLPIAGARGAWKDGAWLIGDGHTCLLVSRVRFRRGTKLAVLVFHPNGSEVRMGEARFALEELRGIRAFVQAGGGESFPRARLFFGEIEPMAQPEVLH